MDKPPTRVLLRIQKGNLRTAPILVFYFFIPWRNKKREGEQIGGVI